MPRPAAERAAYALLRLVDLLVPKLRRVAMRNLELACPELPASERPRRVNGCFRSLARVLTALAKFPDINHSNVHRWIRYEGYEHFENALKRGKGVIFATAHLGNWELSAFAHALMSQPMSFVVRPLDNPLLDSLATRLRQMSGNVVIGRNGILRPILRALHANRAVGILADQNVALDEGVFVDFFGRKACVDSGLARLAARTGAAVIPGFAVWSQAEQRFILRFYPPLEITGDEIQDTQSVQSALERAIRQYPDQWLWIHRRWKTRPPGSPPLYDV
ncbi:MAG: lipid A biosynthesis acyltransferase [Candidatus Solibacter sp.]|nr:lipid A biosynthesis acyltransferase [Candidatus Solibacter sp.]